MSTRHHTLASAPTPARAPRLRGEAPADQADEGPTATPVGPADQEGEAPASPISVVRHPAHDPLEAIAQVASARRRRLLAVHRRRLAREELEDCYSQATLELLLRVRRGRAFASREHIANALEQRLLSRIRDRRRAIAGRSPIEAAIAHALPLAACEQAGPGAGQRLADARADVERIALQRHELRRIARLARELTPDQRLLLASQLSGGEPPGVFCALHGWTLEKYRKVGQRGRSRLAALLLADAGVPVAGGWSEQMAGERL